MNHKPRIAALFLLFLICCVLTVMLFASLPAYARPNVPDILPTRHIGPDGLKIDRPSVPVTHELKQTLTLVLPKEA